MIDCTIWIYHPFPLKKNDFSFKTETKHIKFDFAYINHSWHSGEDGPLQGLFRYAEQPYSKLGLLPCAPPLASLLVILS